MRVLVADGDARPSRVLPVVVAAAFVVVVRVEAVEIIFPTLRFVGGSGAVGGVAVRGLERVVVRIWFGIVVVVVVVGRRRRVRGGRRWCWRASTREDRVGRRRKRPGW